MNFIFPSQLSLFIQSLKKGIIWVFLKLPRIQIFYTFSPWAINILKNLIILFLEATSTMHLE